MPLLTDEDYEALRHSRIEISEDEDERFVIFRRIMLPAGLYTDSYADVLVLIPPSYPSDGNDMLWTWPRLRLASGAAIVKSSDVGGRDPRHWDGREFCRWSRHWNAGTPGAWRSGVDDILSIYRRVTWALEHPACQ